MILYGNSYFSNDDRHPLFGSHHQKFIDENQANWAKVRVFDSAVDSVPMEVPEVAMT